MSRSAPDSRPGSDLLAKQKFDAVIIDCDDMENGIATFEDYFARSQSNAKSVAFAVVNGKTTTQEAFQSGANFVLQKPVTPLHAARCFNAALNFMVRERRRYFRHPVDMPLRISLPNSSRNDRRGDQRERGRNGDPRHRKVAEGCGGKVQLHASRTPTPRSN